MESSPDLVPTLSHVVPSVPPAAPSSRTAPFAASKTEAKAPARLSTGFCTTVTAGQNTFSMPPPLPDCQPPGQTSPASAADAHGCTPTAPLHETHPLVASARDGGAFETPLRLSPSPLRRDCDSSASSSSSSSTSTPSRTGRRGSLDGPLREAPLGTPPGPSPAAPRSRGSSRADRRDAPTRRSPTRSGSDSHRSRAPGHDGRDSDGPHAVPAFS